MYLVKRDDRQESVHFDKITARLKKLSYGLSQEHCELDELAAKTIAAMTANHRDYASLASRIAISNLHKNTKKSFSETIKGGGKRKGAFVVYLEPWHGDIFEILDLHENHGKV